MAKIQEEVIAITISRLTKGGEKLDSLVDQETLDAIESVVQELIGKDAIVEVSTAS